VGGIDHVGRDLRARAADHDLGGDVDAHGWSSIDTSMIVEQTPRAFPAII